MTKSTAPLEGSEGWSAAQFEDWLTTMNLSGRGAAVALGIDRDSVQKYRKTGAPRPVMLACKGYETERKVDKIEFNVTLNRDTTPLSSAQQEVFKRWFRVNRSEVELNALRFEGQDWFRHNPRLSFPWYTERDHAEKLTDWYREKLWDDVQSALAAARGE